AKKTEQIEKHVAELEIADEQGSKKKRKPLVIIIGPDGQIRRHSIDSRERAQALKEIGVSTLPVIVLEEI
ncbi:unnamed protein product, partial [marine sediment metagenome]